MPVEERHEVGRHGIVRVRRGVRRAPVVALVEREDAKLLAEDVAAERVPVATGTKQAVQDDERRPVGAVGTREKLHGGR